MRRGALFAGLCLLAASPAQGQDCNRAAIDLFDASRRSRTALDDMLRVTRLYDETMALYEEELPSGPGFLGAGALVQGHDLGALPVCNAAGGARLSLGRLRMAGIGRWDDDDGAYSVRVMYVRSSHSLSGQVFVQTSAETHQRATYASARLINEQSYLGARVIMPEVDLTAGLIQVGGVRREGEDLGVPGVGEAADVALGVHLRVGLPALNGLTADVVIGGALDHLETAVLDLPVPLPYDLAGTVSAAWLNDESRGVVRLAARGPWDIVSGDVGFETSTAFFRHIRLHGRYMAQPIRGFDPDDMGLDPLWTRFLSLYVRLGVDAELSRFSGRHFEDVNGASGATGYALYGTLAGHALLIPLRLQFRFGGGRNRVDLLEHAVAFADRSEFMMDMVLSLGW